MDHAAPNGAHGDPQDELVLYTRPGCGLCDETRDVLEALLTRRARPAESPVPRLAERDIDADPALERAFFSDIPVIEIAGRRTPGHQPAEDRAANAEVLGG